MVPDLTAQAAALSMHVEEADEEEKEEEEVDMWWENEEEEYIEEEEEKGAFEPEPEEPEEQSKLAAEKGRQFRVFDAGGAK